MKIENLENRKLLTVTVSGGNVTILGTAGADTVDIFDGIVAGHTSIRLNGVTTDAVLTSSSIIQVSLLAEKDTLRYTATGGYRMNVDGGDGNDVIYNGRSPADTIYGGNGDDRIVFVSWLAGSSDDVHGGAGKDTIDFSTSFSSFGLSIDFDDSPDDGHLVGHVVDDHINIHSDFEVFLGSPQNDFVYTYGNIPMLLDGGAGDDDLLGTNGNNTLIGGQGNDTLTGRVGNDSINGNDGNDSIICGEGNDTCNGGLGIDTISYASFPLAIRFNLGMTTANIGPTQIDTITDHFEIFIGGSGNDTLTGTASAETIRGESGNDLIRGGDGNDSIFGGPGGDILFGEIGNDTIDGEIGIDSIYGGDGNDSLLGSADADLLSGDVGNDTINGGNGANTLRGGDGDDNLTGGINNDSITGDLGNDLLTGNAGNDTLNGNAGNDTINDGDGNDSILGDLGNDLFATGLGSDTYIGGDGNDYIDYTTHSLGVIINLTTAGGDGNLGENDDVRNDIEVIFGTLNTDIITGSSQNQVIYGNDGNDTISSGGGNDFISGGNGNDKLTGGSLGETITGGNGDDSIVAGDGNDSVTGDAGNDTILCGNGNDTANGNAGDDTILGEAGNDSLLGEAGYDTIRGGAGNDTIDGSTEDDSLFGEAGTDTINGGSGNDFLNGGLDADLMSGVSGDDVLVGLDTSRDTMSGGTGVDGFWSSSSTPDSLLDRTATEILCSVGSYVNAAAAQNATQIADPTLKSGLHYVNFSTLPLFAHGGPVIDNILQQTLGDCWFLATLGALARGNPTYIRDTIVDLGDGTYAIRTRSNDFYRIDADFPVNSSNVPVYAGVGSGVNRSIWAPLFEKVMVQARDGGYNASRQYSNVESGFAGQAWAALGFPSQTKRFYLEDATGVEQPWDWIHNRIAEGKVVTYATDNANQPLVNSHVYTVIDFVSEGGTVKLKLRNPWGTDGSNPVQGANDGYITLTQTQVNGLDYELVAVNVK